MENIIDKYYERNNDNLINQINIIFGSKYRVSDYKNIPNKEILKVIKFILKDSNIEIRKLINGILYCFSEEMRQYEENYEHNYDNIVVILEKYRQILMEIYNDKKNISRRYGNYEKYKDEEFLQSSPIHIITRLFVKVQFDIKIGVYSIDDELQQLLNIMSKSYKFKASLQTGSHIKSDFDIGEQIVISQDSLLEIDYKIASLESQIDILTTDLKFYENEFNNLPQSSAGFEKQEEILRKKEELKYKKSGLIEEKKRLLKLKKQMLIALSSDLKKKDSIISAKDRYSKKSFFWKLFHRKFDPNNMDFSETPVVDIEELYNEQRKK